VTRCFALMQPLPAVFGVELSWNAPSAGAVRSAAAAAAAAPVKVVYQVEVEIMSQPNAAPGMSERERRELVDGKPNANGMWCAAVLPE
jgi:hypothetical protein